MKKLKSLLLVFIIPCMFCGITSNDNKILEKEETPIIGDEQPQQIHIALGGLENEIVVTWVTTKRAHNESIVFYGSMNEGLKYEAKGTASLFQDGGSLNRTMYIHRTHLQDLQPDTYYIYRCGGEEGWSEVFYFKTIKEGTNWTVNLALYGDLGLKNPQSLARLQLEAENGVYDAIIHVGDFAYDMHDDDAKVGDAFMNNIQPIAAYVPYMVCPGNHEEKYNFSNYRARFSMPLYDQTENMYYSWNIGPVHFIAINTEAYYFLNYGIKPLFNLNRWLKKDLQAATTPEARNQRPWIILYGHRPMYCSNIDKDDCTYNDCVLRVGIPFFGKKWFALEKLLAQYGVDIVVWAHEHSYERLWPIYDYTVLNGTKSDNPYDNPRGPVHLITGSAGCQERKDYFLPKPEWSAYRSNDYGYSRLIVHNTTHLNWEQVSDDKDGDIIDNIWIIKDSHAPYSNLMSADTEEN